MVPWKQEKASLFLTSQTKRKDNAEEEEGGHAWETGEAYKVDGGRRKMIRLI